MKYKNLLLIFIISLWSVSVQAVKDEWKEKMIYGGAAYGAVGSQGGSILINPIIGYRIVDGLHSGIGLSYQFASNHFISYKSHIFGTHIFTRYRIVDFFFLQAEYEHLFLRRLDISGSGTDKRLNFPLMMLGGGLSFGGEDAYSYIAIMFDLVDNNYSPYTNPSVRFGYIF